MNTLTKILMILAMICIVISVVVYFKMPSINVFWNDLHSGDTLSMYEFARYNVQRGNFFDGIKYSCLASIRAIEFRKHRQAAQPTIEEYSRLYQQRDYKNALIACEKARTILEEYDDEGAMAYECVKTKEQLLNQTQNH
jgi:hypothetical protein